MPVYIAQAGSTPIVKIGWGRNAAKRVKDLQTGHHERLRIIRLIEGPRSTEFWMQRRFKAQHIGGEWFHLVPEMLTESPSLSQPSLHLRMPLRYHKSAPLSLRADFIDFLETGSEVTGKRSLEWVLGMHRGQLSPRRYAIAAMRARRALARPGADPAP